MRTNKRIIKAIEVLNRESKDLYSDGEISKPQLKARLEVIEDLTIMLELD